MILSFIHSFCQVLYDTTLGGYVYLPACSAGADLSSWVDLIYRWGAGQRATHESASSTGKREILLMSIDPKPCKYIRPTASEPHETYLSSTSIAMYAC